MRSLWASEPLGDLRLGRRGALSFKGIWQPYYIFLFILFLFLFFIIRILLISF